MRQGWQKVLIFVVIVVIPAIAVGYGNYYVFPDAIAQTMAMLIVTVCVAGILSYFSGYATPKIARYAVITHLILCGALCVNLIFHFAISRELSSAKSAVTSRHEEGDRAQTEKDRDTQRAIALAAARKDELSALAAQQREERRLQVQLPVAQRRASSGATTAGVEPAATPKPAVFASSVAPVTHVVVLTPEEVRESWRNWLLWIAALEVLASVLGAAILLSIWEWDKNGDGIDDRLQYAQQRTATMSPAPTPAIARTPNPTNTNFTNSGGNPTTNF